MTWSAVIFSPGDLAEAINEIVRACGTLTGYTREPDGIHLTWTTDAPLLDHT